MTKRQRQEIQWALDLLRGYMATEEGMSDPEEYEILKKQGERLTALEVSLDLLSSL